MLTIALVMVALALPQDAPAQPTAEAELAATFQAAAPDLFKDWIPTYRKALQEAGLGEKADASGQCYWAWYFEFMTCKEQVPPKLVGLDVVKTESLLTPFVGKIRVQVQEICTVRRVVAGATLNEEKYRMIEPSCIGKPYKDCIDAGGKPASKSTWAGAACTGGPELTFPFESDEIILHYRWSNGKWEFEREEAKEQRQAPASKT